MRFIKQIINEWIEWRKFRRLPRLFRRLVVYSEGSQDWPHIGPMIQVYLERHNTEKICYVTSSVDDPGGRYMHPNFVCFRIGNGIVRTLFFSLLECDVLLMTMADLDSFHIKRSRVYPVHYVYCFHSINSTHTVYRPNAFSSYDTILCVGPHHVNELRREEELGLAPKRQLLEHGSVKLDTVSGMYADIRKEHDIIESPLILLAPSWGTGSFAEHPVLIRLIIGIICKENWKCCLRLHPMTCRHCSSDIDGLKDHFSAEIAIGKFVIEDDLNDNTSLRNATVMVSDWSGAALEFAFGLNRPVLFIDTPQKINNPRWTDFGLIGIEDGIRSEIGEILALKDVHEINVVIHRLIERSDSYSMRNMVYRNKIIFNFSHSAEVGAKHLYNLQNRRIESGNHQGSGRYKS